MNRYSIYNCILEAEAAFWMLSNASIDAVCNGCGAMDSWIPKWAVPGTMWGLCIEVCCIIHDWDYHVGRTKLERKLADKRFHRNIKALINEAYEGGIKDQILWRLRMVRAQTYYMAVRVFGGRAFKQNQGGTYGV